MIWHIAMPAAGADIIGRHHLVGSARGLQANAQGVRGHGGGLARPVALEQRLGVTHHRDDNLASGRQIVD